MQLLHVTCVLLPLVAMATARTLKFRPDIEPLSQKMTDYINLKAQTTWKVCITQQPRTD